MMDTYLRVSYKCKKCGRCVSACQNEGYGHLEGGRGIRAETYDDNLCCHHCSKPCIDACHYNCIEISRY